MKTEACRKIQEHSESLTLPSSPPAMQPTLHPVLIPQNQFCVMSLDPDTLPSIATTLIDVLFYSGR